MMIVCVCVRAALPAGAEVTGVAVPTALPVIVKL